MTSVFALIILVVAAYLVIIAGGIAFETTGMDREMARFQALSAFTGVGFTTLAAEQVVEHRTRRNIAMVLIIAGWAGGASVIATLIRSFYVDSTLKSVGNYLIGILFAALLVLILQRFSDELVSWMRRILARRIGGHLVPHEDLLRVDGGLGLSRIEVPEASRVLGRTLSDLDLRKENLSVVLIERQHITIIPKADSVMQPRDHVVVFGRLDHVQTAFAPEDGP